MVWVQIPASTPYVGWVCCWFFSLFRDVFLRLLWFSPLLKNQRFQIQIRLRIRYMYMKNHHVDMLPQNRYLFIYLFIHSFIHSLIHLFMCSFIYLFIYFHLLIYLFNTLPSQPYSSIRKQMVWCHVTGRIRTNFAINGVKNVFTDTSSSLVLPSISCEKKKRKTKRLWHLEYLRRKRKRKNIEICHLPKSAKTKASAANCTTWPSFILIIVPFYTKRISFMPGLSIRITLKSFQPLVWYIYVNCQLIIKS